jgi:hypothetical protein
MSLKHCSSQTLWRWRGIIQDAMMTCEGLPPQSTKISKRLNTSTGYFRRLADP